MNLIKFDPWLSDRQPCLHTNRRIPVVFDDFVGRNIGNFVGADFATNVPSVNIAETTQGYELEIAAPGLAKKDFRIFLDKDRLTVSSERSNKNETKEGKFTRREFNFSAFSRSFVLPKTVDKDTISAKYENGVLVLSLAKKAEVVKEEKSRVIEIG